MEDVKFKCPHCSTHRSASKINDQPIQHSKDLLLKMEIWQCDDCNKFFMPTYRLEKILLMEVDPYDEND